MFASECTSEKVITLTENSSLQSQVLDKDVSENDLIGTASLDNIMTAGRPYSAIELTTEGQLRSATVTLVPVDGVSPTVSAPSTP
jgi:hypothetical protein